MDFGQILLFVAVMGLVVTLLVAIPINFGQKAGLWLIKKRFSAWSEGKAGELSVSLSPSWGLVAVIFIGSSVARLVFMLFAVLEMPYITMQQRMWQPLFIFNLSQTGQLLQVLQGFRYTALHSILMVITFFICGVATIFVRWHHFMRDCLKSRL